MRPHPAKAVLHAEWTKLRTLGTTGPLLVAIIAVTVLAGCAASALVSCGTEGCGYDPAEISLFGVQAGQSLVAVLAVLAIGGEYGTGMIRLTLAAMPSRTGVLAAKAIIVAALTLGAASIAVLVSVLVTRPLLLHNGFPPEPLTLTSDPLLRAAAGSVLYLVLTGLFSLGVATAVRDSAVAIAVVLGTLYLFPALILLVSDDDWQRLLWQVSPMNAGLAVQATTELDSLPLTPWEGLGVLGAWTLAALLVGGLLLRRRDA